MVHAQELVYFVLQSYQHMQIKNPRHVPYLITTTFKSLTL